MREINTFQLIPIPEGCEVKVHARVITVTGKRGTLTRNFKHLYIDVYVLEETNEIKVILLFTVIEDYLLFIMY